MAEVESSSANRRSRGGISRPQRASSPTASIFPRSKRPPRWRSASGSKDAFAGSPIHTLLEQSRARLKPLASLFDARSFAVLPDDLREKLLPHVQLRTLAPGDMLVSGGTCRRASSS